MPKKHLKMYTKPQNIGYCFKWRDVALLETWTRYWQKGHVKRRQKSLQVKPHLQYSIHIIHMRAALAELCLLACMVIKLNTPKWDILATNVAIYFA